MPKPVTNVVRPRPASPKPVWQRTELFVEPAGLPQHDIDDQDDDFTSGEERASIITA